MLSTLPPPAPLHARQDDLAPSSSATSSIAPTAFEEATAPFQRRLHVELDGGRTIDAAFPGVLVPADQDGAELETYLRGLSSLATHDNAPSSAFETASPLRRLLFHHGGALHFQRTPLRTADDFSRFLHTLAEHDGWTAHVDRGLMVLRNPHALNVATANEGPPTQSIGSHNEFGLSSRFPSYIAFFCLSPPEEGGETPIASSLELLRELSRDVPEYIHAVDREGVAYTIHHPRDTIEGSIQGNALFSSSAFGPDSGPEGVEGLNEEQKRKVVEDNVASLAAEGGWSSSVTTDEPHWKRRGFSTAWQDDGSVLVTQRVPGVRTHPTWRTQTYFNNIHNRLSYSRDADALSPPHVAHNQKTARGTPFFQFPPHIVGEHEDRLLGPDWIRALEDTTARLQVDVKWQPGDVLLLDNLAVQHARRTWKGDRRLLASLWDQK